MKNILLLLTIVLVFFSNAFAFSQIRTINASDVQHDSVSLYSTEVVNNNSTDKPIEFSVFYTYKMAPNGEDTVVAIRRLNNWWFGITGGPNFGVSFGDLYSKLNPSAPANTIINQIVGFNNSFGWGYYWGIVGEYLPTNSNFGYGLRIIPFDRDITEVTSDKMADGFDTEFDFDSKITYLTFTPYLRYSVPSLAGFHLTGGADVKINTSSLLEQIASFDASGHIIHKYEVKDIGAKSRFGISLGVGYDFFFADFFGFNNRVRLTPFVDLKIGTDVISDLGSNWNNIGIKVGAQIKLSPDKVIYDTLFYNPASEEVPVYYASSRNDLGVEYPGISRFEAPPGIDLALVEFPEEPSITITGKDTTDVTVDIATNVPVTPPAERPRLRLAVGSSMTTTFSGSATTQLTPAQRDTLDQIADYLRANAGTGIRIEGHSDNAGTGQQNANRATARFENAKRYLMSKGIPERRILGQGRAALFPVATNDTPAGRRQNRRLEYTITRP